MANSFYPADILIPKNEIDMTKWSVVACDQFTSEPQYWEDVEKTIGTSLSTLNLIFPEIYLSKGDAVIDKINKNMKEYIESDIFDEYKNSFVYLKRTLPTGKVRQGLIGAIDLEDYTFHKGSAGNVRATEGTVLERIPPRVKIRENAPLEFPHIMVLIDDINATVIEPLEDKSKNYQKIYDFELIKNGGHIEGYCVPQSENQRILDALDVLAREDEFNRKYNVENLPVLTYAVGDGNHSLATAKTCWENIKKNIPKDELNSHPARFALVELVNLHDLSLEFEPIHRVVFNVDPQDLYSAIFKFYPSAEEFDNGGKMIVCKWKNIEKSVWIKDAKNNLAVGTLQNFIDDYLKNNPKASVDYIHGENVVNSLSKGDNTIGFLLPAMEKCDLFKTVILDGSLPRKTFSMGEANEKRYYLEGRKIR